MQAAKRLKYGAEKLGQERGWEERQNGRLSHRFASFHRETRKCARALPATLPKAVQNGNLPEEPLGTIAGKFSYFSPKEASAALPGVPPLSALGEITESAHVKFIHREVMKTSNKHRINLALSPDNPLQREALDVLAQAPPGTRTMLICQALCEYQKNKALVEKLRSVIREELSNASIQAVPKEELPKEAVEDNRKALDFIRSLQGD